MTIQIQQPVNGTQVTFPVSPPNYQVSGVNDTGDDVCGWLLDTNTDNAFVSIAETIGYDAATQLWDWTLQFQTDATLVNNDYVTVNVYDAETGGDGEYVTVQQQAPAIAAAPAAGAGAGAGAGAAAPHSVIPSAAIQAGPVAAGVQDINLTITLQPAGVKGSIFLSLLKIGGPGLVLHHHLPDSTQIVRTVIFRQIDVAYWDRIHAVAVIRRHTGKPSVARIRWVRSRIGMLSFDQPLGLAPSGWSPPWIHLRPYDSPSATRPASMRTTCRASRSASAALCVTYNVGMSHSCSTCSM